MSIRLLDLLWRSLLQTLGMVFVSGAVAFAIGLPLALLLVVTASDGIRPVRRPGSKPVREVVAGRDLPGLGIAEVGIVLEPAGEIDIPLRHWVDVDVDLGRIDVTRPVAGILRQQYPSS